MLAENEVAERLESHVDECPNCMRVLAAVVESGLGPEWLHVCRETSNSSLVNSKSRTVQLEETMDCSASSSADPLQAVEPLLSIANVVIGSTNGLAKVGWGLSGWVPTWSCDAELH